MKDSGEIFIGKLFTPCRSEILTQLELAAKFPVAGLRPGSDQPRCLRAKQRYSHKSSRYTCQFTSPPKLFAET